MSTPREHIRVLDNLKEDFDQHLQDVTDFIKESAEKRAEAIQTGEIHLISKAIAAEISLASGLERLDIIEFLLDRLQRMSQLDAEIQAIETEVYQETFDQT